MSTAGRDEVDTAPTRKLSAILCADVEAYSRSMGYNEAGTHRTLVHLRQRFVAAVRAGGGRVVSTSGDGILADFPSAVSAVRAAWSAQSDISDANAKSDATDRLSFRVGIHLGDVIADGDDLFGDGVNVAARIQSIAPSGGVAISAAVYDAVKNKVEPSFVRLGPRRLKNIEHPVEVYAAKPGQPAGVPYGRRRLVVGSLVAGFLGAAFAAAVASGLLPLPVQSPLTERLDDASPPTLAVFPFTVRTGDDDTTYFGEGIADDLLVALGRFSNLEVTSRSAVYSSEGERLPLGDLRSIRGIDYAVEGSIRRSDDRLRVTARLIETLDGTIVWSETFDRELDDLFAVQDAIVAGVVGELVATIDRVEVERALGAAPESLRGYDLLLRGRNLMRTLKRQDTLMARSLFERAIELDPKYAPAHSALAETYLYAALYGFTEWPRQALETAQKHLATAIKLDDTLAEPYVGLATVHRLLGREHLLESAIKRALEINPNSGPALAQRGITLLEAGKFDEARPYLERALRFDPIAQPSWRSDLSLVHYFRREYDTAIEIGEMCVVRRTGHPPCVINLAAAYAMAGQQSDAERVAAMVSRLAPFFMASAYVDRFQSEPVRQHLQEGLAKAGL